MTFNEANTVEAFVRDLLCGGIPELAEGFGRNLAAAAAAQPQQGKPSIYAHPETLVIWEAQYGDFANVAQVVIDQFITSGEAKWGRLCGLTMFLPHGYEGQGPEHSSARLERFMQLCANHNIQVCVPSTPAQMFHLLRRQVMQPTRKPLVVMTPKSLLRSKAATSKMKFLTGGRFQQVIGDRGPGDADEIKRVVFCAGKIYYDLAEKRDAENIREVAVMRTLGASRRRLIGAVLAEFGLLGLLGGLLAAMLASVSGYLIAVELFDLPGRFSPATWALGIGGGTLVVAAEQRADRCGFSLPDLASRLGWGVTYVLRPLDDADMLAALTCRAAGRGLELPAETASFLLKRIPRDPASVFDLLDRLDAASMIEQRRLTIPFVKSVLAQLCAATPAS